MDIASSLQAVTEEIVSKLPPKLKKNIKLKIYACREVLHLTVYKNN